MHARWLARIADTDVSRLRLVHEELVTSYTHLIFSFRQVDSVIRSAAVLLTSSGPLGLTIAAADPGTTTQMISTII